MLPKILIVEDSLLLRTILRNALREAEFIVYESENGRNALSSAKEIRPHMIILDVLMPVMDGMTMYDQLRKEEWGKEIPVLILTSSEGENIQHWITDRSLDSVKKDDKMVKNVVEKVREKLGILK